MNPFQTHDASIAFANGRGGGEGGSCFKTFQDGPLLFRCESGNLLLCFDRKTFTPVCLIRKLHFPLMKCFGEMCLKYKKESILRKRGLQILRAFGGFHSLAPPNRQQQIRRPDCGASGCVTGPHVADLVPKTSCKPKLQKHIKNILYCPYTLIRKSCFFIFGRF